jgi:hypothetical protein
MREASWQSDAVTFIGKTFMIKRTAKLQKQQAQVIKQIRKMHGEMGDLRDCLDLLEARAVNEGKGTYSIDEVKATLGIT